MEAYRGASRDYQLRRRPHHFLSEPLSRSSDATLFFLPERDLFGVNCSGGQAGWTCRGRAHGLRGRYRRISPSPPGLAHAKPRWPSGKLCINSPYREEYVAGIFREVIERYHPKEVKRRHYFAVSSMVSQLWKMLRRILRDRLANTRRVSRTGSRETAMAVRGNSPCINSPYREEYVAGIFREAM